MRGSGTLMRAATFLNLDMMPVNDFAEERLPGRA
jgi:hypothetical protein